MLVKSSQKLAHVIPCSIFSEGLPTQAVINLLDDYGEDAKDKYPAKYGGKPAHVRDTSARIRVERGER